MAKLTMKNIKAHRQTATPVGQLIWINLAEPRPLTAPMQAGKYTCTVVFDKKDSEQQAVIKSLVETVIEVGREAYGDNSLKLADFPQSVLKDGDDKADTHPYLAGKWYVSSSTGSKFPPKVYGAVLSKGTMTTEQIQNISQGDYGRLVVNVAAYKTPAQNGVTSYLSFVQFAKKGEYIGGGGAIGSLLGDLDVEPAETEEETGLDDFFNV